VAHESETVVVLTVGNKLRSDDRAGLLFGELLREFSTVLVFEGGDAPESITGQIQRAQPDCILIVDALDFRGKPGEIKCIEAREITETGTSTHVSLKLLISYLDSATGARIYILGIQPKTLELGSNLSYEVSKSIRDKINAIKTHPAGVLSVINELNSPRVSVNVSLDMH